jgi:hypothetical protein
MSERHGDPEGGQKVGGSSTETLSEDLDRLKPIYLVHAHRRTVGVSHDHSFSDEGK